MKLFFSLHSILLVFKHYQLSVSLIVNPWQYQSVINFNDLRKGVDLLKISNFNAAVFSNVLTSHCNDIQFEQFCASEVLLKAGWTYSADIWNLNMMVRAFDFETTIHAMLLTSTSQHSCESFYRTLHFLMGLSLKVTDTLVKLISLRWLAYLNHPHKSCWIGQTVQYTLVCTLCKVCTTTQSADFAYNPRWIQISKTRPLWSYYFFQSHTLPPRRG